MPEPTMSSPDHTTYRQPLEDFATLRAIVGTLPERLNLVLSWSIVVEGDESYSGTTQFEVIVFMPRKSATTTYSTTRFDRVEVEAWLAGPIRERAMRWFGCETWPAPVGYVLAECDDDGNPWRANPHVMPEEIARDVHARGRAVFALHEPNGLADMGEC